MAITSGEDVLASDFINKSERNGTLTNDVGRVAKLESNGYIHREFVQPVNFGDGSDGDVTISSPTTLTRDMYYNNLTVNDTLTTNGYRIYVKETISGSGTIDWGTANNGANGGGDMNGGAGGAQSGSGPLKNSAGGRGGNDDGQSEAVIAGTIGPNGATGGNGDGASPSGDGIAGGITNNAVGNLSINTFLYPLALGGFFNVSGTFEFYTVSGSGGGGHTGNGGSTSTLGGGGGAGASGGIILICAHTWAGTFTIQSVGGNGGNGHNGSNGDGGGGAGGNGGVAVVLYYIKTWTGTYTLTGGTGGTNGGGSGQAGASGNTGESFEIQVQSLI